MKSKLNYVIFISLLLGCNPKQSSETPTTTDSAQSVKEVVSAEPTEAKPTIGEKDAGKISLDEASLTKFPFATKYTTKLLFSENGEVNHWTAPNGEKNAYSWKLSGSSIQVAIDQDTATFNVQSFKEDELVLVTADEFGGKLFGETRQDFGDYRGQYYISLYRLVFSAPYSEDQVSGGWQAREGGCSFEPGGAFSFGAADCNVNGTWEFDGENLTIALTQKDCGWSDPFDTNLKVVGLGQKLMLVKNSKGAIEAFTRL